MAGLTLLVTLAACASLSEEQAPGFAPTEEAPTATVTPSPTTETSPFASEDCPVDDEEFCAVAVVMVNAVASEDPEAIVGLSRSQVLECRDIQYEFFPDCETADVLEGYAIVTVGFTIEGLPFTSEVLTREDYRARLETVFSNVDASFSDEYGGGAPTVIGLGKCGGQPNTTWTAAVSEEGAPAQRVFAYFEFSVGEDGWLSDVLILETIPSSGATGFGGDPIDDVGCDATSNPWPS